MKILGFVVLALIIGASSRAQADSCNGVIQIGYPIVQNPNVQGSIDRVQVTLGAGPIENGTTLTINQIFFDLDCDAGSIPASCTDQGAIIRYQGDSTITTDCAGITFASNVVAGGSATNEVVFTLTPPLVIGAGVSPFCHVQFDIQKLTGSDPDSTPYFIEERAGFANGNCDNTLNASGISTGALAEATPTTTPTTTATNTPTPTPTQTPTNTPTQTPTQTLTQTPTLTPTQTPTQTPTLTPTQTPTLTPTVPPTFTPPPVPVVPSPTSPAGLLLVTGLGVSIAWMLTRMARGRVPR